MKISKLFHWLYALVMLLPIFAIGSACLISTFNMSGKQESEITYKYETNEVNDINDLISGNIYHFEIKNQSIDEIFTAVGNWTFDFYFVNVKSYNFSNYNFRVDETLTESVMENGIISFELYGDYNETIFNLYLTDNEDNNYFVSLNTSSLDNASFTLVGDFIFDFANDISSFGNCITQCENIPIESVETHNLQPDDIFYRAVNKVTESPLFSWAYNSFLAVPIVYITNLFSIPSTSVIIELLSYWLAISIIWLVFDLIMYVPLLVHRWIDKGVLE